MKAFCLAAFVMLAACTDPEPPQILGITVENSFANTSDVIVFSVEVLNDYDGPFTYAWDFGDGTSSVSPKPSHRFEEAGQYGVSVTVQNESGSATETTVVDVREPDADLYFWTQTNVNGQIQVTIDGQTRFVVAYYTQFPGCMRGAGMAEFLDLPYGTYSYTAVAQSGKPWNGTVTLGKHCTNIVLN